MPILEGRGLFWWSDDSIPENQFAPNSCVSGHLKIDNDGGASLELDGYLPSEHGPMAMMGQRQLPQTKCIRGLLKGPGQHVLLANLVRNGGQFKSAGISFERFFASTSLISESEPISDKLIFTQLIVPLSGYEEWLRLNSIKVTQAEQSVSVEYKPPEKAAYRLPDGSVTIEFELGGKRAGAVFGTEISMRETASSNFRFEKPLGLDEIKTQYQLFEDLLILLTSTDYALDWPWVALDDKSRYRVYFRKIGDHTAGTAPKYFECVTNFVQLRESFGSIWDAWKNKREEFGPGLYLYLGTRRGMPLYVEHRFANLVWGLETFHRRKHATEENSKLKSKINRIIEQITIAKDKKWLSSQLKNAHEPSLGERIFQTITSIPLGLEEDRIRDFSNECARLRNDLSHFGGLRSEKSYNDVMVELLDRSEALASLYQMLLLHEIGIDERTLKWWTFEGHRSYPIKVHFVKVGLLDKSAIEPQQPPKLLN
jgi:hypothetical protein